MGPSPLHWPLDEMEADFMQAKAKAATPSLRLTDCQDTEQTSLGTRTVGCPSLRGPPECLLALPGKFSKDQSHCCGPNKKEIIRSAGGKGLMQMPRDEETDSQERNSGQDITSSHQRQNITGYRISTKNKTDYLTSCHGSS